MTCLRILPYSNSSSSYYHLSGKLGKLSSPDENVVSSTRESSSWAHSKNGSCCTEKTKLRKLSVSCIFRQKAGSGSRFRLL